MAELYNRNASHLPSSDWWEGHQDPSQHSRRGGVENQATDSLRAGQSLTGTSVEQISQSMKTWRNVTIQITNYSTTYTLSNPRIHTTQGYCFHPPQPTIEKNTSEACCFSKTAHVARGAIGVMTYQILTDDRHCVAELAIMFSVPYDNNLFRNWFALGIYKTPISCDYNLFYQMYYTNGPFTRAKGTGNSIEYHGKRVYVKGTMSAFGQSIMKVEFRDR
ncbi:bryoporin-like [Colossoma macropomum]|uniref:bryoporin-like n=1 Tax=Colossoma macropomum TaxID=42526 RepID=UPI00186438AB|nr:bryoporin-like [Colossoma macropomum]